MQAEALTSQDECAPAARNRGSNQQERTHMNILNVKREFDMSLALIRFWRHQRRNSAKYLMGQSLLNYRTKCTKEIWYYIHQAKDVRKLMEVE